MAQKIYIAGPMRGKPNYNFDAFDHAKRFLQEGGWTVISPADMDRLFEGYSPYPPVEKDEPFRKEDFKRFITRDLLTIGDCDAIFMIHGWENSKGATAELALATFLELEIHFAEDSYRGEDVLLVETNEVPDVPEGTDYA